MKRNLFQDITVNPKVCFGKPVIEGARVPVDIVVGKMAGRVEIEQVTDGYELTRDQVRAALRYAAELVATEEVVSFV